MIPTFPEFKKIEISDKEEIENFTKDYPPYSDFNFVALFCWDVDNRRQVSMLNGNLVVRFTDDMSGKKFISLLGNNKIEDTVENLLCFAKKQGFKPVLRMVPEEVAEKILDGGIEKREDADSFDYVYVLADMVSCNGQRYADVRNSYNRFNKKYGDRVSVRIFNISTDESMQCLTDIWNKWNGIQENYSKREERAARKLFENCSDFDLFNVMIFVEDVPVAFSINQIIDDSFAISHFAKVDYTYEGAFPYLWRETARKLLSRGCEFLNMEEDLGLPGLRRAKESWRMALYLRKYTIRRKRLVDKIRNILRPTK